jgi:hypothetical protein
MKPSDVNFTSASDVCTSALAAALFGCYDIETTNGNYSVFCLAN